MMAFLTIERHNTKDDRFPGGFLVDPSVAKPPLRIDPPNRSSWWHSLLQFFAVDEVEIDGVSSRRDKMVWTKSVA